MYVNQQKESTKEDIFELVYEAIDTIRGKKHEAPNDFSICNFLNANVNGKKISLNTVLHFERIEKRLKMELIPISECTRVILQF